MLIRDALTAVPDVTPLQLRTGQVLVYPRHVPPGIFVVLAGALRRFGETGETLEPVVMAPFAVPGADELVEPAYRGISAVTDVETLFVPRSVLLRDACVARILAATGLATVTLQLNDRRTG